MPTPELPADRFARVKAAFDADGFDTCKVVDPTDPTKTVDWIEKDGCVGVLATHRTSCIGQDPSKPKKAYYVEGSSYQMGWLLGCLAEPDVALMTKKYAYEVVFAFVHASASQAVKDLVHQIAFVASKRMEPDLPQSLKDEMKGLLDGCTQRNPATVVTWDDLWALNCGVDTVLAHVWSGEVFGDQVSPAHLKIPYMCNAVYVGGSVTEGGRHFFGRDFMFPTAEVYQDTAALIVCRPDPRDGVARRPFVMQTAPGLVGACTALNDAGVGMGVNMLPSNLCDAGRPGLDSLNLVRECIELCSSSDDVVEHVVQAPRGVAWLYPVADRNGRACAIEAGCQLDEDAPFPYFEDVPWYYARHLPHVSYIEEKRTKYETPAPRRGLMARWNDYRYPTDYVVDYNESLYRAYNLDLFALGAEVIHDLGEDWPLVKQHDWSGLWTKLKAQWDELCGMAHYDPNAFGPDGFINVLRSDENCPGAFYFAPQRESSPDVLMATNHPLTPEMRFTAMTEWMSLLGGDLVGNQFDDMQWRYDRLNYRVRQAIAAGPIDDAAAWKLANFLRPDPAAEPPENVYYGPGPDGNWKLIQVNGSVSLCDLDASKLTSLYGYYGDEPISIRLPLYL